MSNKFVSPIKNKESVNNCSHTDNDFASSSSSDFSPYLPPRNIIEVVNNEPGQSNNLVMQRWRVGHQIGTGSHADVFIAYKEKIDQSIISNFQESNLLTEEIAVKVEPLDVHHPSVGPEYKILSELQDSTGIPKAHFYVEEDNMAMMGLQLLGCSLEKLKTQNNRLSVTSVAELGKQLVRIFEDLHKKSYIHRSVKPENFCVGKGSIEEEGKVYMIDFGRCVFYRNPQTLEHIPYHDDSWRYSNWTSVFSSVNSDYKIEKSRRDDLEALAHILLYLIRGNLPWEHLYKSSQKLRRLKRSYPIDDLLYIDDENDGNNTTNKKQLPIEFAMFLTYTRNLQFNEDPDYDYLFSLMQNISDDNKYLFEWQFINNNCFQNKKRKCSPDHEQDFCDDNAPLKKIKIN